MHHKRHDNYRQGVMLIVGSVGLLALADALVKYLGAGPSLWQLLTLASSISIPLLAGSLFLSGGWSALIPQQAIWVMLRSLLLLGMWLLFYASLPLIPLATAAVGIYTTPLFIAVLASVVGEERLSRRRWGAIALGFAGVLLVLRPGLGVFSYAMILPVTAAGCYAGAMVLTRRHCPGERPMMLALGLNLSFSLAGIVGSGAVTLLFDESPLSLGFLSRSWQPLGLAQGSLIVLYALLMVGINTGVARAYQIAPPSVIGTFDYAYLPFAAGWGVVLFDEIPDLPTVAGMGVILLSGWLVTKRPDG